MSEVGKNPNLHQLEPSRSVNVDGTLNLTRQAGLTGIKGFVFRSFITVNGEWTRLDNAITPFDAPLPMDAYTFSKSNAKRRFL